MRQMKVVNPCDGCTHKCICMYRSEMKGNICNTIEQILTNDELVNRGLKVNIHCPFRNIGNAGSELILRG